MLRKQVVSWPGSNTSIHFNTVAVRLGLHVWGMGGEGEGLGGMNFRLYTKSQGCDMQLREQSQ